MAWGLSPLLKLISTSFEFDYGNFCLYWISFIDCWWFVVVLSLEEYFTLFLQIFGLMELFTFLWKGNLVKTLFESISKHGRCSGYIKIRKNKTQSFFHSWKKLQILC